MRIWEIPDADGESFSEWAEEEPRHWEFDQLPSMYRAALNVACRAGFRPIGAANWVFRDEGGSWWALRERERLSLSGRGPMAWRLPMGGFSSSGDDVRDQAYSPRELLDDLGGQDGPVAWALWVIDMVASLREAKAFRLKRAQEVRALTELPEWKALAAAVKAGGDPQAVEGLKLLTLHLKFDGWLAMRGSLDWGFRFGQELGVFLAVDGVTRQEIERTGAVKKSDLRSLIREIVNTEHASGVEIKPYVLARALLEERGETARGRQLMALGVPTEDRLGRLIADEARAAGILPARD